MRCTLALTLALLLAEPLSAQTAARVTPFEQELLEQEGVLGAQPGFRWRREALLALERGEPAQVQAHLLRAARYADKPAQALVAERYWHGDGVAQDRALAYAWMDLAAERGYTVFVAHRENYWAALDDGERQRALREGQQIYADYGDAVAKPRLERHLENRLRQQTGSRTGARSAVEVYLPPAVNPSGASGIGKQGTDRFYLGKRLPNYYQAKLWKADAWFDWQDAQYVGLPEGVVSVGAVSAESTDAAATPDDRTRSGDD